MSGAALCAALTELGFDGEDPLDADALEWPFQYEEARPLLAWICSCLRPSNVLSPSHLAQYEQLVEEGRLLEVYSQNSFHLSTCSEAKLAYRAEVFELQKQLARQQAQFDLLAGQASTLIQGRRARLSAMSTVSGQLVSLDEILSSRNLEMNAVLGRIAATTQELAHYHSGDEESIYLAYSDFHPYVIGDLTCTKELNRWFSKQFEKGPFRLVAEEGKSKCSWVSLDDITNCLMRGDSEKSHHHQRVAELQRLRSMRKGSELAGELSTLSQKVQAFVSETIPCLCSELAQLQGTYILQGDYDLKVMRQEYYINRQKTFINHLVNQLARHQFLKIACQLERKNIASAYSLLRVIESELQSYLSAVNTRLGHYNSLIQAASEVREQGAIDDRDTFLHAVRDLLCIHSNVQATVPTYMSAHALVQQISALQSDLLSLQSELENTLPADRKRCINELCTLIQTVEQLLFASSTTAEPILTPWPLMRALDDMENANAQVEVSVEEVTKARTQKIKIFENRAHEVGRERQIFIDFFCNPERLKNQVRELTSRVKALQD
ncbi:AUGMIN subunit 3 [Dichanthelium oligosanthes]|uniref:AUGMIN subunit 3 n=1 Tax=Dichanthelium oligosanthes TaxID=888268 RepID=A0A1E5VKV3_9POAL|nr:AUGMIN subunit 3 [Dichanthelium oligosanthes]